VTDTPDGTPAEESPRPRPTPRPRAAGARPGPRPSPRPRVAGSRRADEDGDGTPPVAPRRRPAAVPRPTPAAGATVKAPQTAKTSRTSKTSEAATTARASKAPEPAATRPRRRVPALVLVLALLCVAVAAGGGYLLLQRLQPGSVDAAVFAAARSGVEDVYAYDYRDSQGSVDRKLDALTGELREQYEADLSQGGIIDTYEQVSATTSYEVLEVGLQQVNEAQDTATLVVFGQYVVESVNSGTQAAPAGSECTVTDEGAQSCTQTVRVTVTDVDGDWKISELTLLTTS